MEILSEIEEELYGDDEGVRNVGGEEEEVVYVLVGGKQGDEPLSMDALLWTLNHSTTILHQSSSLLFLLLVFPETKSIPTPLGNLPVNQVNPEQRNKYMAKERGKRRDFIQKFLDVCSTHQVKVDTVVIENEMEGKAILDLIQILNIRKLVMGATKSTIRRMRSGKGSGVADQIVQSAPDYCEVKIICEGKEMSELMMMESPSPSPSHRTLDSTLNFAQEQHQTRIDSFACGCFKI